MRKTLLILFLLAYNFSNAQSILAKKGTITLATNEKVAFENLQLIEGQFQYLDPSTGDEKKLAIKTVKVVDDENYKRVFTNRSIIVSSEISSQGVVLEKTKPDFAHDSLMQKKELKIEYNSIAANGCPDGIYFGKEDFLNKKPNSKAEIVPKELVGWEKEELSGIPDECFFYLVSEDKRIKNVFAICYRGHIYFQTQAILENRNKTDRAQTHDFPNGFVKVKFLGENFYYMEANLINKWVQGLGYSGGAIGGAAASTAKNYKGIVWDVKNKEFNIFKNCKDYNEFISIHYPEGIQDCENQQPDIFKVREAIEKIK